MSTCAPRGAACLLAVLLALFTCGVNPPSGSLAASHAQAPPAEAQGNEQQARATCSSCHAFPPPDILPRESWRDEFVRMMYFREGRQAPNMPVSRYSRTVQLPPDMEQALPFFTSRAPDRLPPPAPWPAPGSSPVSFVRGGLSMPDMPPTPAISHVQLEDLDGDKRLDVLGTDMRQGLVFIGRPSNGAGALSVLASIPHPSHV